MIFRRLGREGINVLSCILAHNVMNPAKRIGDRTAESPRNAQKKDGDRYQISALPSPRVRRLRIFGVKLTTKAASITLRRTLS